MVRAACFWERWNLQEFCEQVVNPLIVWNDSLEAHSQSIYTMEIGKCYQWGIDLLWVYLFAFIFMATPAAHGSFWPRDWIQAAASIYITSVAILQGRFNPLHQVRDRTRTPEGTWATVVRFLTHCTTVGTPDLLCFWLSENIFGKGAASQYFLCGPYSLHCR